MSATEELLGFVDLVAMMFAAHEVFTRTRDRKDYEKFLKIKAAVEQVMKEIHRDYRGQAL